MSIKELYYDARPTKSQDRHHLFQMLQIRGVELHSYLYLHCNSIMCGPTSKYIICAFPYVGPEINTRTDPYLNIVRAFMHFIIKIRKSYQVVAFVDNRLKFWGYEQRIQIQ